MKIAIWHNLPSGGGKRALYEQVQGLLRAGHEVEAWCPSTAAQHFLPLGQLIKENLLPLETPRWLPKSHNLRRLVRVFEVRANLKRMEEHCRRCTQAMATGGFDLLLAHPCQAFHASAIAQFTELPTVLYLQEPFRPFYEAFPRSPWAALPEKFRPLSPGFWQRYVSDFLTNAAMRVQARAELQWVKSFDQVLVNSRFSRESVVRAYNLDARVCYLGVDLGHFRPTTAPKERFVVALGAFAFLKRPFFALQCIAAIPKEKRPKLVWVGNSGNVEAVKREAIKLGVELEVHLLIPDEKLLDLLGRAAAMIYTSHLEPLGYAPLEANACGTAVVGIAEGGVRESIVPGENGLLIPNLDPVAFAETLLPFCEDLDYATAFGKKARLHAEKYWSAEIAAATLEKELERILEAREVRPVMA
jgi:glycosyltransferase involved in cell wall biosynthesis